jgi:hypothetical protein
MANLSEFAVVNEVCYFCDHEKTVLFNEHYSFCPDCSAIYTSMMAVESCPHFKDDVLVTTREPWFAHLREELREKGKAYIVEDEGNGLGQCSICGKLCIADGW